VTGSGSGSGSGNGNGNGNGVLTALFAALIILACTASVIAVSEKNQGERNYWALTNYEDRQFADVKAALAKGGLSQSMWPRARQLAVVYRQQNKMAEAANIYRILWPLEKNPDDFIALALDLASVYSDMGGFASALPIYKEVFAYDKRLGKDNSVIARDYNNLAVCYRAMASTSADPAVRTENLLLAERESNLALSTAGGASNLISFNAAMIERDKSGAAFDDPARMAFFHLNK